jgi:hypothetical protein
MFEYGQTYVALSRATDMEGLYLRDFDRSSVRAHPKVREFYRSIGYNEREVVSDELVEVTVKQLAEQFKPQLLTYEEYEELIRKQRLKNERNDEDKGSRRGGANDDDDDDRGGTWLDASSSAVYQAARSEKNDENRLFSLSPPNANAKSEYNTNKTTSWDRSAGFNVSKPASAVYAPQNHTHAHTHNSANAYSHINRDVSTKSEPGLMYMNNHYHTHIHSSSSSSSGNISGNGSIHTSATSTAAASVYGAQISSVQSNFYSNATLPIYRMPVPAPAPVQTQGQVYAPQAPSPKPQLTQEQRE